MRFLLKWLRVERPPGIALHPSRTIELDIPPAQAFARSMEGIEHILGGFVRESDAARGTIEATFGLVNSERLMVTIEETVDKTVDKAQSKSSRVIIESRRGASPEPPKSSQYVEALANYLLNE